MKYMLDTNICIYAIKNKPGDVLSKLKEHLEDGICISTITLAELQFGVEKSQYREKNQFALLKFLSFIEVLPFDTYAAVEYGKINFDLKQKGQLIGNMDMLIAAHAKSRDITVVTNNEREFKRVENLKLENWVS